MAALSSSRCRPASSATSAGVLRHRASGRRRSDPRPEHGTSARTRSNVPGGHGAWRPSAARTAGVPPPARRRASRTRRARCGWMSEATRRAPRAAARPLSSRALPPGPAHRSSQSWSPLAGQADPGQGERGQLAGLVLDGRLAAGDQGRRVTAGQPEAVGRPAGALAVGPGQLVRAEDRRGRVGCGQGGAEREDYLGANVAGGEGVLGLGGGRAERVAEGVDDPAGIAVPHRQVAGRVPGPVRRDDLDPGVQVAGGHPAQDRVDEAGRTGAADVLGQVDRGRHGGVVPTLVASSWCAPSLSTSRTGGSSSSRSLHAARMAS